MRDYIDDLINFLSHPGSYPDQVENIEIIQTHASVVAITDKYVYKFKKPINFEFMDFSTLEKRRFFCLEEIRLNKRLTGNIYLDILSIYRSEAGAFSFDPIGPEVDCAIKMRRFAPEGFFSSLLKNGKVRQRHYDLIVERLCKFYNSLPPQNLNPEYGSIESIQYIISENQKVRVKFINKTLHPIQEEIISDYQAIFLKENETLIENRINDGWIRDTHGDLRLEHFHFAGYELNIYDCIEFEERLRVNDLVNDIAFLSMELDFMGFSQEARQVHNKIVKCTGDSQQEALWLFYKTHRACVRGMVHAVTAFEHGVGEKEKQYNRETSAQHFALATRYVLLGAKPTVIVVSGGVATGKSAIAKKLSELLFIPHIQSDVTRKELAGIPIDEYPTKATREWLYSDEMTQKTYAAMIKKGIVLLERFNAVILDSRWSTPGQKELLTTNFPDGNIFQVRTTADLELRKDRLKARESEKTISDARLVVFEQLLKDEEGLFEEEDKGMILIDTSHPLDYCVEEIFKLLGKDSLR